MQLHPREQFTITRQLQNHLITDTLYVRAVIRNAKTDTIIETVDLTDRTGQRFSKSWLVPADVSGQGFWISIVTSVYSDSGYTTKSENYGDEEATYLVQERYIFNPNYPVGPDIDYKRLQKMMDETMKRIYADMKPAEPEVRIETKIVKEPQIVEVIKEVIKEVRVPELKIVESIKEPNLTPITDKMVVRSDLSPIFDAVVTLASKLREIESALKRPEDAPKVDSRVEKLVGKPNKPTKYDSRIIKLMKIK